MKKLKHWLAHLFGTNTGEVVTWWDADALKSGFQCHGCGKTLMAHTIGVYTYAKNMRRRFQWLIRL